MKNPSRAWRRRGLAAALSAAIGVTALVAAVPNAAVAAELVKPVRLSGADRYSTAAAISRSTFTDPAQVHGVVVASGVSFPDALSGGPLAAQLGGPVLLTNGKSLTRETASELARLGRVDRVYVIGGPSVVSSAIERKLGANGPVTRLAGADRYSTSLAVAKEIGKRGPVGAAFVADGRNYPDALSAGAPAAIAGNPIILVPGNRPAQQATKQTVRSIGVTKAHVVGGAAVVSNAAANLGVPVTRYGGGDRFATNSLVNAAFAQKGKPIYLAAGLAFPDALAAGAAAAHTGGSLVLTAPNALPPAARATLAAQKGSPLIVVGGPGAVSASVLSAADKILRQSTTSPKPPTLPGLNPSEYFAQTIVRRAYEPGSFTFPDSEQAKATIRDTISIAKADWQKDLPAGTTAKVTWTRNSQRVTALDGKTSVTVTNSDVRTFLRATVTISGPNREPMSYEYEPVLVILDPTISKQAWDTAFEKQFDQLLRAEYSRNHASLPPYDSTYDWQIAGANGWVQHLADEQLPLDHSSRVRWYDSFCPPEQIPSGCGPAGENVYMSGSGKVAYRDVTSAQQAARSAFGAWMASTGHHKIMVVNGMSGQYAYTTYWAAAAVDWKTGTIYASFSWF